MNKRWNSCSMLERGERLFKKMLKKKRLLQANHTIHALARTLDQWLPAAIQSLCEGTYHPDFLRRYHFTDETVDALSVPDRILQHILLQQLKKTFPYTLNKNCLHVHGPKGVKMATDRLREALATNEFHYFMRIDIKSYYASISHKKLIADVKASYDDPKVQALLERVILNPIETPLGFRNPDRGIALRGPLSQFFAGLFLKPLDDAFDTAEGLYLRYNDDIIFLCKTKAQLQRYQKKMMKILHERKLKLSRKKSRLGSLEKGFHFLGIEFFGPRTQKNTTSTLKSAILANQVIPAASSPLLGGGGDYCRTGNAGAAFSVALYASSCEDLSKSSNPDHKHDSDWVLCLPDSSLSARLGRVVESTLRNLASGRNSSRVCGALLGSRTKGLCRRASSQTC